MLIGYDSVNVDLYAAAKPLAALYGRAPVANGGDPLPCFGSSGTGGVEGVDFIQSRQGYSRYAIIILGQSILQASYEPYTELMKEVKVGFGRTISQLPAVFGVSRQTLYNWLSGDTPKDAHKSKLIQLAAASNVFIETGFKPTPLSLDRTISQGKSFIDLLSEGADGKEMAHLLVSIVKRGARAKDKLDALLDDRTPLRLGNVDFSQPDFTDKA